MNGKKIFLGLSIVAALILMSTSDTQAMVTAPYVPAGPDPAPSPVPSPTPVVTTPAQPAYYPPVGNIWIALNAHPTDYKTILADPYNGVTQVSSKQSISNIYGFVVASKLLPFQKISSVYWHAGCHYQAGDINNFCSQDAMCVFPYDVYQTHDGYYISVFYNTNQNRASNSPTTLNQVLGFALYDPNMNYATKIMMTADWYGYTGTYDLHPPGSPEYKTKDLSVQCQIITA